MNVKVLLLMNFAIAVNSQPTISGRSDDSYECQLQCEDINSEMKSIRQQLMDLKRAAVRNDTQMMQKLKTEMDKIRQIVIQQQYWSRNEYRKTECPFGFDYLPGAKGCYSIIFEEMTWGNATERCREIMPGVHLAAITSQEENTAITNYIRSKFNGTRLRSSRNVTANWCPNGYLVWMSAQRKYGRCNDPIVWKIFDGIEVPLSYTNWGRGEPNCDSAETCVHMASCKDLAWNDYRCHHLSFPLCEI